MLGWVMLCRGREDDEQRTRMMA
jgi:hypothetical protein